MKIANPRTGLNLYFTELERKFINGDRIAVKFGTLSEPFMRVVTDPKGRKLSANQSTSHPYRVQLTKDDTKALKLPPFGGEVLKCVQAKEGGLAILDRPKMNVPVATKVNGRGRAKKPEPIPNSMLDSIREAVNAVNKFKAKYDNLVVMTVEDDGFLRLSYFFEVGPK